MEWCKSEYLWRKATKEQLSLMGRRSQEVQALRRINGDPVLYHPIGKKFCGLIYSLNCQYDEPVEQLTLLFDTNNRESYRAIVNNQKADDRAGWHEWHTRNAKAMQQRFITED